MELTQEQLLTLVEQSRDADLAALLTAKETAKRLVLEKPTEANVRAFEKATKALDDRVKALRGPTPAGETTFANESEVYKDFIVPERWRCSKASVYNHVKAMKLVARADGKFHLADVEAWAKANFKRKPAPAEAGAGDDAAPKAASGAAEKKALSQASLFEVQAKLRSLELAEKEGKVLPVDVVERELAWRTAAFRSGLEGWAQTAATRVAALFGASDHEARRIVALVASEDLDPAELDAKAQAVSSLMLSRGEEFVEMWRGLVAGFLEPFATGAWWTPEMAEAMRRAGVLPAADGEE